MKRLALAALVLLAGCGGHGSGGGSSSYPLALGRCTVYSSSGGATVTFDGYGAERACDRLIRQRAEAGDYWTRRDNGTGGRYVVCGLTDPNLAGRVTVRDTGGAFVGQNICASFTAAGFIDVTPGTESGD